MNKQVKHTPVSTLAKGKGFLFCDLSKKVFGKGLENVPSTIVQPSFCRGMQVIIESKVPLTALKTSLSVGSSVSLFCPRFTEKGNCKAHMKEISRDLQFFISHPLTLYFLDKSNVRCPDRIVNRRASRIDERFFSSRDNSTRN